MPVTEPRIRWRPMVTSGCRGWRRASSERRTDLVAVEHLDLVSVGPQSLGEAQHDGGPTRAR
jgi:hypothetical protein